TLLAWKFAYQLQVVLYLFVFPARAPKCDDETELTTYRCGTLLHLSLWSHWSCLSWYMNLESTFERSMQDLLVCYWE
ncbi:unnamed protein product, partial [Staurois parvus]